MEPALQDDDGKNRPRNEWARMAKKLREIAADIEAEPIPDRFARLLEPPPDRLRPAGAARQARVDIEVHDLRAKPLLRVGSVAAHSDLWKSTDALRSVTTLSRGASRYLRGRWG